MNAKKLLIPLVFLVGLIVLTSPTAFATTWYVNNSAIGNDGRNGQSPTIPSPDDGVTGPKKTLGGSPFGAIAAANAGDIIIVANTTVPYGTGTGEPATIAVTKQLTFQSSDGTVEISSLVQINNANAAPANTVIFNAGNFLLSGGLTLTVGVLQNTADLLTVSGTITRSIAAATVASQLKYSGTVDFVYAGGAAITAGNEFPASGTFNNVTTTGAGTNLTLKTTSASMSGVFTTVGTLNLGGNALTITNTGAAVHAVGGNVTNGTLVFSLGGGDVTVNGAFAIPAVTVSTSTSTARTLAIAQPTSITGPVTVSGKASVTTSTALITVGAASFAGDEIVLGGTGGVTLSGTPTTVNGNIVASGTGVVLLNGSAATVNGNVLLNSADLNASNAGQITFAGAGAVTVTGNVTNSAGIALGAGAAVSGAGRITFPDQVISITGNVIVNGTVSGTAKAADAYTDNLVINFGNSTTLVTIGGTVTNDCKLTSAGIAGATVSTEGQIWFQSTTGNIVATGGFVNSSAMPKILGTNASNGIIQTPNRTTGTIGTVASRTGLVSCVSVSDQPGNGNIFFQNTATGAFYGTSVSQGAVGAGGIIYFGTAAFDITGNVTNARTATGSDILTYGGPITVGGSVTNSGKSNITLDLVTAAAAAGITGKVENSGDGTIAFTNANSGAITIGGLVVSKGMVSIPATHTANLAINGAVDISGGTASLLASGAGETIVITGSASFTGGAFTTTGRTSVTTNSTSITIGGTASNTTFSPNTTEIIVGNPSPTSLVTITIGTFNPTIAGNLTVNNTTGLAEAVRVQGGSLIVNGNLTLTAGAVNIVGGAAISVVGNVVNTAGYATPATGRITLAGTGAQTFGGAGIFGNIEFKNTAAAMTTSSAVTLAGTIYLTAGSVSDAGGVITINNTTVLPTVVLNAGTFSNAPTYNSNVNITYIGTDKTTGNEIPTSATRLQNLTIATTNGATAGKGIVTINGDMTVNGILTVNSLQALSIPTTRTLTLKGDSVVLTGDIINVGTGKLSLAKATGTKIVGAGYLPPIEIAAGSSGNSIGAKAIINELLGTDGIYGGAADFAPATGTAQGTLTYIAGTNSATVALTGITDGSMVGAVTTADAGNTLTLGANLVVAGTLTHAAGKIDVATFTLEQRGATITIGPAASATFAGTGLLKFYQKDNTTNTAFTLNSDAAGSTIGVNVELNNTDATAGQDQLILATGPLTIAGSLTITDGNLVMNQNLTLTGSAATITTNGTVSGASILRLNASTPPLVFTYTGAPTISNLTISNNVTLAGSGTGLTISTAFLHDGGNLAFGDKNLEITGTFTRTNDAGTYSAGAGYLILRNASVNQASGFSIPNLQFGKNPDAINFALAGTGTITVTKKLTIDNATANTITHTVGGAAKLAVADSVNVYYSEGKFDVAPVYAGGINLHLINAAARTVDATVWPATAALVRQLEVNNTATAVLPGARTVNKEILLTAGTLDLSAAAQVLTLVDASDINVVAGILTTSAGSTKYGNTNNVTYKITAAYNADKELPATVKNLTFTRTGNIANAAVTIKHSVTVNGILSIKNNVTVPVAPPAIILTANSDVTIAKETGSNATNPVCLFNQSMVFGGANSTLTVPNVTPPLNIGSITLDKSRNANTITLTGGSIQTGVVTFVQGSIVTGDNVVYLPAPTTADVAGGATSQGFTGAGPSSMIVGNVAKTLVNDGTNGGSTESSSIFPVGTGVIYRPMTLTFNPAFGVPTTPNATIVVGHVNSSPGGSQALPIVDGVEPGVPIARYPSFYWSVYTVGTVSPSTKFDLGLTGGNFTDFDSPANVRIIRRHGKVTDINNDWLLQGSNTNYDNEVNAVTGFTAINRESVAGLRTGGAVFTYGLKTNIVVATLAPVEIHKSGTAYPPYKLALGKNVFSNYVGTLTYVVSSTNSTVASAVVTGDTLVVTAQKDGNATINIKATDENNDFAIAALNITASSVGVVENVLPKAFRLAQNYPNPFNPTTNISFDVPKNSSVKIVIYDMLGREVKTLVNANYAPGTYTVPFNAASLASGVYIYRMTSQPVNGEMFTSVKKLMLMK